jgi:hypothetical protein
VEGNDRRVLHKVNNVKTHQISHGNLERISLVVAGNAVPGIDLLSRRRTFGAKASEA